MKRIRNIIILVVILLAGVPRIAEAQQVSLSTNALTWANLGTMNLEAGVSVSKHFTVFAGAKYNPWELRTKSQVTLMNQQITGYAGAKYWPWHVYSGWWFGTKVQYMDFTETGVIRPKVFQGKSIGLGLSFGYSWMLHEHLNIEAGCGLWGGRHFQYSVYRTAASMDLLRSGPKNFIFIDDLTLSIVYVF